MFTGTIKDVAEVVSVPTGPANPGLIIRSRRLANSLGVGDPVAVNGVQLVVTRHLRAALMVDPTLDALQRTTLGRLQPGDRVNLEPPVPALGLLTGHIVHGHPDYVTQLRARHDHPDGPALTIDVPPPLTRYLVPGGWISLDGVSLTTATLAGGTLTTRPDTALHATTLHHAQPGAMLNLELDRLVQHLERLLTAAHLTGTTWPRP